MIEQSKRLILAIFLPPGFGRERQPSLTSWVETIFEPAALTLLVGLYISAVVSFFLTFDPGWDARPILPLSLAGALLAFFYGRRLVNLSFRLKEWTAFLLPLFLLLRAYPYSVGQRDLFVDVFLWTANPWSFFDLGYLVGVILIVIAWLFSLLATLDLVALRVQKGELPDSSLTQRQLDLNEGGFRPLDHGAPLRALASKILWGGVVVTMLAGLVSLEVAQRLSVEALLALFAFERPSAALAHAGVILYFTVALLLLVEARLIRQQTAWAIERLDTPPSLPNRWIAQGIIATAIVVSLALILPIGYAMTLAELFAAIMSVILLIGQILGWLVLMIIYIISTPFRLLLPPGDISSETPPPPAIATPPPTEVASDGSLGAVLGSAFFWLVAIGILIYVLTVLWNKRPEGMRATIGSLVGFGRSALEAIIAFARAILAGLTRAGSSAVEAIIGAIRGQRDGAPLAFRPQRRFRPFARMTPGELIEFYYLSVIERATRLGIPRESGETASEYARRLASRLPETEPELDDLTQSFLESRYSTRPPTMTLVGIARERWNRLKLRLRGRRLGGAK